VPASRAALMQLALRLVEQSTGDGSFLHAKFLLEAHLSVARLLGTSDATQARSHLERAAAALEVACGAAGEGERWARKRDELRFALLMGWSQTLAESGGEQRSEALECAAKAKGLLASLPENAADLGVFCYNCGVREHRARQFDASVAWIQLSIDSFDRLHNASSLCRSLRLLAATQLDSGRHEPAKKAVLLALEIDHSALSLAMLCRVHLLAEDRPALEQVQCRLLLVPFLISIYSSPCPVCFSRLPI
jgi:hypothetical protein